MRNIKEFIILLLILLGTGYAIIMLVCFPFGMFVGITTDNPDHTYFWLHHGFTAICQLVTSYTLIKISDGPPEKKDNK